VSRTTRAVALVGGLFGGVVSYVLYPDPLLAATAAFVWGVAGALTYRERETWTRGSEGVSLANAVPAVLLSVVGTMGVHAGLPLPDSLRWALVALVFGAVLAAVGAGIALGRRGTAASGSTAESTGAASDGAD
jgi:Flp pilus assembly protein TadB